MRDASRFTSRRVGSGRALESCEMTTQENMLARHRILHELGRGPTGAVYAARDHARGTVVALKRLDPASTDKSDASFADRFLKHARSAGRLRHRNVVTIHDAGEAAGTAYVAMEMLEGDNLRKILDDGPLPIARAIRIVHEIACGLAYAHLEGVVHGGLKPSNVIVLRSGVVKITDFRIGNGCLGYQSPEQMRNEPLDHRCDIFSLGVLFYEMLSGRRPFEGGSPKEILENIRRAEPQPPSKLNPLVPRALDAIVSSMLAKEPAARMPGVPVLIRELQRLEDGLGMQPGAGADEPESVPPADPAPARHREPKIDREVLDHNKMIRELQRLEEALGLQRGAGADERASVQPPEPALRREPVINREVFDHHRAMMARESAGDRPSRSRYSIFAALAVVIAVLGFGLAGFKELNGLMEDWWSSRSEREAATREAAASRMREAPPPPVAEAPAAAVTAPRAPQASPVHAVDQRQTDEESATEASANKESANQESAIVSVPDVSVPEPTPPKPLAAEPEASPSTESAIARAPEQPAPPDAAPAQQPAGTARLIIAVSPRGELYIDGRRHGTIPPVTTLDLEPGMHRVEIRNGSRKPYLTYMTVQAGDVRRIRHDFNAKPRLPPR